MSHFDESFSIGERIDRCRYVCMAWITGKLKLIFGTLESIVHFFIFSFAMLVDLGRRICCLPLGLPHLAFAVRCHAQHWLERSRQLKNDLADTARHFYGWLWQTNERRLERAEFVREVKPAIHRIRTEADPSLLRQSISMTANAEHFSVGFRVSHLKVIVSFALLCGVGWLIYSVAVSDVSRSTARRESFSGSIAANVDKQLDKIASQTDSGRTDYFSLVAESSPLEETRTRLENLDSISTQADLSPTQQARIDRLRLQNLGAMVQGYTDGDVNCDELKSELLALCESHLSSENLELRNDSQFWIIAIAAIEFSAAPDEATLQNFVSHYDKYPEICRQDADRADMIYRLMLAAHKVHGHLESTTGGMLFFQNQIRDSNNSAIQTKSEKLLTLAIFGKYNLDTLAKRVSWGGPAARDDLESVIEKLSQNPESGEDTWLEVIRSCESLLSVSDYAAFDLAIGRVSNLVEQLPDSSVKRRLQSRLERQQIRRNLVGQPFDATGNSVPDSNRIPLTDGQYKVVLLAARDRRSEEEINILDSLSSNANYLTIIAFRESRFSDARIAASISETLFLANSETANKYFDAIPIDFHPYALLIDKSDKVIAVNINASEIDSCISRHQKKDNEL